MRHTKIIQRFAAVCSQLNYIAALLYMIQVLSTTIISNTSHLSTASVTGHTSAQLSSSNVA